MYKIQVLACEKQHPSWLEEAIAPYIKRLKGQVQLTFTFAKNEAQLEELALKAKNSSAAALLIFDPLGQLLDSLQFSSLLFKQLIAGGSQVTLLIGGASGLSPKLKELGINISLSPLTFTHQLARLLIVEQIYRAFAIEQNSPYHK